MPLQVFDRINDVNAPKLRSMEFEKYFGEMDLTDEQKRERIALAQDLEDAMLFLFYLILAQNEYSYMAAISSVEIKDEFRRRLEETVSQHTELNDEIREQIDSFSTEVTDTTLEHVVVLGTITNQPNPEPKKKESEEYYLSDDRARFLAEEESNTVFGYSDYGKAIRLGYKYKEWVSIRDSHVRPTHQRIDGKIIPIRELFLVGKHSFMRFPRDESHSPEAREVINCRCTVKYHK